MDLELIGQLVNVTLSASRLHESGGLSSTHAVATIVTGVVTNGLFKLGIIGRVGGPRLLAACALPLGGMLAAALAGIAWSSISR